MQHFRGWLQVNRSILSLLFFPFSFLSFFILNFWGSRLDSSFSLAFSFGWLIHFLFPLKCFYFIKQIQWALWHSARNQWTHTHTVIYHKFVITAITKANCQNREWLAWHFALCRNGKNSSQLICWSPFLRSCVRSVSSPQIKIPKYELSVAFAAVIWTLCRSKN